MKITPKLAEALTNLRGNRDFAVVMESVAEHQLEETQRCIDADAPLQIRAAGAVKALQWWHWAYEEAPKAFEKFKNQPPQQGKNTP